MALNFTLLADTETGFPVSSHKGDTSNAAVVDHASSDYHVTDSSLSALVAWQESIATAFGYLTPHRLDLQPTDLGPLYSFGEDAMATSWSSAATGKPQLSYAERLRRAKEIAGPPTELSSNEPSTASEPPTPLGTSFVGPGSGENATYTSMVARSDFPQASTGKASALEGVKVSAREPVNVSSATTDEPQQAVQKPTQAVKPQQGNVWEARMRQVETKAKPEQHVPGQAAVTSEQDPEAPPASSQSAHSFVARFDVASETSGKTTQVVATSATPPISVSSSWLKPLIEKKRDANTPDAEMRNQDARRQPGKPASKVLDESSAVDAAARRSSSNPETRNPQSRLLRDEADDKGAGQRTAARRVDESGATVPDSLAVEKLSLEAGTSVPETSSDSTASKHSLKGQKARDAKSMYSGGRSPRGTRGRGSSRRTDEAFIRLGDEANRIPSSDSMTDLKALNDRAGEPPASTSKVTQQRAQANTKPLSYTTGGVRQNVGPRRSSSAAARSAQYGYDSRAYAAPMGYPLGSYVAGPMGMPMLPPPNAMPMAAFGSPAFTAPISFGMPIMESTPDEFAPSGTSTESEPTRALLLQIEFYFSHMNLQGDFFLRKSMDGLGFVPIEVVATFNRVKRLAGENNVDLIKQTLHFSRVLQLNDDDTKVRKAFGWESYVLIGGEHAQQPQHFLHPLSGGGAGAPYFYGQPTMPMSGQQHNQYPNQVAAAEEQQSHQSQAKELTANVGADDDDDDDDEDDDDDDDESSLGVIAATGFGGTLNAGGGAVQS